MATILEYIVEQQKLNTLERAVRAADLVEYFMGSGPFTIFAPQDGAFMQLPSGLLDKLLANTDQLAELLKYHVVSGEMMGDQLQDEGMVQSLQGENLQIDMNPEGFLTVNMATVIQPNIQVDNGVVHIIDRVLMPPSMTKRMAA